MKLTAIYSIPFDVTNAVALVSVSEDKKNVHFLCPVSHIALGPSLHPYPFNSSIALDTETLSGV
jgi:hypothetical protein